MSRTYENIPPEEVENAYIFNNIFSVESYVTTANNEIAGQINALDNHLIAADKLAKQRFVESKQRLSSLYFQEDDVAAVKDIVVDQRIVVPIDDEFIDGLFLLHTSEKSAAQTMLTDPEIVDQVRKTVVQDMLDELMIRRQLREIELGMQTEKTLRLSMGREFSLIVPADESKLDVRVQMDVDPTTEPVSMGPDSVVVILGGRLTDEDYDAIAEQAKVLPGVVGEVCREQLAASAEFAQAVQEFGQPTADVSRRISYAENALSELLYKNATSYNPAIAIIRLALDRSAMRHFTPYKDQEIPQPFNS